MTHPPSLADRDQLDRFDRAEVVPAEWSTSRPAWSGSRSPRNPPRPSSDRMKQTSWLSGLAAVLQPQLRGGLAHLGLGQVADGEQGAGQLLLSQHGEHIGLVLQSGRLPAVGGTAPAGEASRRAWCPVATASNPRMRARASNRSNLRCRLHSMQGLGVRPSA